MKIITTNRPGGERHFGLRAGPDGLHVHLGNRSFTLRRNRYATETSIAAYEDRYRETGRGLFSELTSGATPLLDEFIDKLRTDGSKTIIEAGAGSGRQAIHIATSLDDVAVLAVEPNAHLTGIHETLITTPPDQFGQGSRIAVVPQDVFVHLSEQQPGSISGIHAHSLVHFWDTGTRGAFYGAAHRTLVSDGLLAVSLKAKGDAQQERATIVGEDQVGTYGKDPDYELVRLFVNNPQAIVEELRRAGFEVVSIQSWTVPGYDFPDQPDKEAIFVGFLARKI